MSQKLDPVTMEIIQAGFTASAEEMKLNLIRTAYNPLVYEVLDFAVGLFDVEGRTLAQASGLPLFLATLPAAIIDGLETYGPDGFEPGDVIMTNDPYTTGTHLGDMKVYSPIFFENELVGFAATMAHLIDLGGKAAGGGWFSDTTDMYQEGIRIKTMKFYRRGELNEDIVGFIKSNSRFSESVLGDLRALVAACRTGERGVLGIINKYGLDASLNYIEGMYNYNERLSRLAVKEIPDGVYEAEAYADNDGVELDETVLLKTKVIVDNDEMTIDFSDCSPATRGPINCGEAAAVSAARVAFMSVTTPHLPANEGNFRAVKVKVAPNSVVSIEEPGPTSAYGVPLVGLIDLVYAALSSAIPDRVGAGHFGDFCSFVLSGINPYTGEPYVHAEGNLGGWGGKSAADGESGLMTLVNGDTRNAPVEVIESRFPVRLEKYEFIPDSGGAGRHRGGLGVERVYRFLEHSPRVSTYAERSTCAPWGLFGGKPGKANNLVLKDSCGQSGVPLLKATAHPVGPEARIHIRPGGGGGYGNPLERDPDQVRRDVISGFVSRQAALTDYGVVLAPETFEIDIDKTEKERAVRSLEQTD